jgi:hypothetical protein
LVLYVSLNLLDCSCSIYINKWLAVDKKDSWGYKNHEYPTQGCPYQEHTQNNVDENRDKAEVAITLNTTELETEIEGLL